LQINGGVPENGCRTEARVGEELEHAGGGGRGEQAAGGEEGRKRVRKDGRKNGRKEGTKEGSNEGMQDGRQDGRMGEST